MQFHINLFNKMKSFIILCIIFLCVNARSNDNFELQNNSSLVPSATVSPTCRVTATTMDFGSYNPLSGNSQSATNVISVICTKTTSYNIGLDQGVGLNANTAIRKMSNGSNFINYTLYQDDSHSILWGNKPGEDTHPGIGSGSPQQLTVYGQINPNQQDAFIGDYSDTIGVTVYF